MSAPVLEVADLRVHFVQYERGLRRRTSTALAGMNLTVAAGEVVALVGASGAGKSLLAHAVLGLLPPNAVEEGVVAIEGATVDPARRRALAGSVTALLPQSVAYLDPVSRVGGQLRRSARLAGHPDPRAVSEAALDRRGLAPDVGRLFPHELSGGMARRVLMAMATMGDPRLLLADEPTTGLPAATVAGIVTELRALADAGSAVVLITHELRAALSVADRVVICRDGRTVDVAPPAAFTGDGARLEHDYTRALWRALPGNGFRVPARADDRVAG